MKSKTKKAAALPPLLALLCRALDEKKAEDLKILKVREQSSITDYLLLATGTSEPHLRALRVELEKAIDANQTRIVGMDTGEAGSGWLVVDAFDVMIHVFTRETRERYGLENLWKDAEEISVKDLLAPPRVPKRAGVKRAPARKATAKPRAKKKSTG